MNEKRGGENKDMMTIKYSFEKHKKSMYRCGNCGLFWGWDTEHNFCPGCGSKSDGIKEVRLTGKEDYDKIVNAEWTNGE